MALLLHLADPFSLSRNQFAAACRWFARWRELAKVLPRPDERPKSGCIAIDLAQACPIHELAGEPEEGRWLAVGSVLRKMSQRLESLAAGEMPEILKLGSALSSAACVELLEHLVERLRHSHVVAPVPEAWAGEASATVAVGLESIHRLLGGRRPDEKPAAYRDRLGAEQIAVFGHVVRRQEGEAKAEGWRVVGQQPGGVALLRPVDSVEPRLVFRSLLAVRVPGQERYALAATTRLCSRAIATGPDNRGFELRVSLTVLPGEPGPLLAEMREKPTGKINTHPALFLAGDTDRATMVVLPIGLTARAMSIRFLDTLDARPLDFRLAALRERGGNYEIWTCARSDDAKELALESD